MLADVDALAGIARDLVGQLYDARLSIIWDRSGKIDRDRFQLALYCAEVMGQIAEAANPTDPGTPYGHEDICRECGDLRANCTGDTVDDPEEEEEEEEDDGERLDCENCGESFNVNESGCEEHCSRCAGPEEHCSPCSDHQKEEA